MELTNDEREELERLREAAKPKALRMAVSPKGCLSVYGLWRFPVTLYSAHWKRLLAHKTEILGFLEANKGVLKQQEPIN